MDGCLESMSPVSVKWSQLFSEIYSASVCRICIESVHFPATAFGNIHLDIMIACKRSTITPKSTLMSIYYQSKHLVLGHYMGVPSPPFSVRLMQRKIHRFAHVTLSKLVLSSSLFISYTTRSV